MTPHPAKYSDKILQAMSMYIRPHTTGLDPMGGVGRIFDIEKYVSPLEIHCVELESEWAKQHPKTQVGDATLLCNLYSPNYFDWIAVSPPYGNRMADHHEARDSSKRNTYRHMLGRQLTFNNVGGMQWGITYRSVMSQIWASCVYVLKDGGYFILNCKNHIRKGVEVDVCGWHVLMLTQIFDLQLIHTQRILQSGNRQGQNGNVRVDHEMVYCFQKKS